MLLLRNLKHSIRGFSLVEIILSTAIFGLLVTALVGAYLYGQEATVLAGSRARAVMLAEGGLEATRNMRDSSVAFANLPDSTGTGLSTTGSQWGFQNNSDTSDIFSRQIVVSTIDINRKTVTSNIAWQQNQQRTGSVAIITRFTNWMRSSTCSTMANCLNVDISGTSINPTDNSDVIGIILSNTGGNSIVIDKMTISWTSGPSNNNIQGIIINSGSVWSGSKKSGDLLDISNFTLNTLTSYPLTSLIFKKNMIGTNINIVFTMTDTSTKTVTGITP